MVERNDALKNNASIPIARYKFALQHIHGPRVVDGACGLGYGCKILSRGGFDLTGIDNSQTAIDYAKKTYPVADYIKCRVEDFDYSKFNSFVFLETIEHLQKPRTFMRELHIPELVISTPVLPSKHLNPYHLHDISERELRTLVEINFKIIDVLKQTVTPVEKYLVIYAKQ